MAKGPNTARIGAFVLLGLALVIGAIAIFGGGRLFVPTQPVSLNFTASMQGLSRGSPVMFSGVPIGEVTSVILRLDEETLQSSSVVLANIFVDRFDRVNVQNRDQGELLKELIDKGLRARLVPISVLTGQLGIEIGLYPGTPLRLTGTKPGITEIPTIPSTVERLEDTMQKILGLLEDADLDALSKNVEDTMQSISSLASMPELRSTIVDASSTMAALRSLTASLGAEAPPLVASLREAADGLRSTARGADQLVGDTRRMLPALQSDLGRIQPTLARMDQLIATADATLKQLSATIRPESPLQLQIDALVRDIARTSAAVRSLATALEDSPNSILFGAVKGTRE
jgi:paraquat-inducible protein B